MFAILGHLIRFFTKEKNQEFDDVPSHFSLLFKNGIILEARFTGVKITHISHFLKKNDIILTLFKNDIPNTYEKSDELLAKSIDRYYRKNYDYLAFFYYFYFILKNKIFKTKIPNMINFNSKDRFYCSELIAVIDIEVKHFTPNSQLLILLEKSNYSILDSIKNLNLETFIS
jgi:hypothetical protein